MKIYKNIINKIIKKHNKIYGIIFTKQDVEFIMKNNKYNIVIDLFKIILKIPPEFTTEDIKHFFIKNNANNIEKTFTLFTEKNNHIMYSVVCLDTEDKIDMYKLNGKALKKTYIFYRYKQFLRQQKLKNL